MHAFILWITDLQVDKVLSLGGNMLNVGNTKLSVIDTISPPRDDSVLVS